MLSSCLMVKSQCSNLSLFQLVHMFMKSQLHARFPRYSHYNKYPNCHHHIVKNNSKNCSKSTTVKSMNSQFLTVKNPGIFIDVPLLNLSDLSPYRSQHRDAWSPLCTRSRMCFRRADLGKVRRKLMGCSQVQGVYPYTLW